ncbi:IMPACT family protein [Pseudothermotoga elfii]
MNGFYTVAKEGSFKLNVKRSLFYSHIFEVSNNESIREKIKYYKQRYIDATHVCWAYRLYETDVIEFSSDGGEPSGTAGLPILNTLKKNNMMNTCCVVARYFGGLKLGVRGLIDAYSEAAYQALKDAGTVALVLMYEHIFRCDYAKMSDLIRSIQSLSGRVKNIEYSDDVVVSAIIPQRLNYPDVVSVIKKLVKMSTPHRL